MAETLVERLRYRVNNPSAWQEFEQAGSDLCDEAAAALEAAIRERDEARALVTEANNSLYGSQGYFHSLNGGPFDKYHLASGIEKLKAQSRSEWRRANAAESSLSTTLAEVERLRGELRQAEAAVEVATFVPWFRTWCKARFGKWITHNTAKGALNDLRSALSQSDGDGQ